MLKLLKKYKMWILAIFGVFIMISFLLADTLQRQAQNIAHNQRVFTMDGEKVTSGHAAAASLAVESLRRTLPPNLLQAIRLPDEGRTENWMMRTHEAERAGLNGGPVDGRQFADDLGQGILQMAVQRILTQDERARGVTWQQKLQQTENLTDEQLATLLASQGSTLIDRTTNTREPAVSGADVFANLRAIGRMTEEVAQIGVASAPRMQKFAQQLDQAFVAYVVVTVDEKQLAAQPEPAEAELQAHFDRFKNVPLNTGDFGMGLKQPDRVAATRLTIDRSAIAAAVKIDPVAVQKKLATTPPLPSTDASTHRRNVEEQLKRDLTEQIVREMASGVRAEIVRAVGTLPEQDGFRVLPADWDASKVDLAAIAKAVTPRVSQKFGLTLPEPVIVAKGIQTQREMAADGVLGMAIAKRGQQSIPASDVLFAAKEFKKPRQVIAAQAGLPIVEPFEDGSQNTHFVLITQAIPEASPANIDEVRARISKDARSIKAVASITAALEEVKPIAMLTSVPDAAKVLRDKGYSVGEQARANVSQARGVNPPDPVVNTPDVIAAAMNAARTLDPTLKIDPLTAGERTFVIAPAGKLAAVLGQVVEFKPFTQTEFQNFGPMIAERIRQADAPALLDRTFSNPELINRLDVQDLKLNAAE
jgi:hypothetical protein